MGQRRCLFRILALKIVDERLQRCRAGCGQAGGFGARINLVTRLGQRQSNRLFVRDQLGLRRLQVRHRGRQRPNLIFLPRGLRQKPCHLGFKADNPALRCSQLALFGGQLAVQRGNQRRLFIALGLGRIQFSVQAIDLIRQPRSLGPL